VRSLGWISSRGTGLSQSIEECADLIQKRLIDLTALKLFQSLLMLLLEGVQELAHDSPP